MKSPPRPIQPRKKKAIYLVWKVLLTGPAALMKSL